MDCGQHKQWTGVENASILENTRRSSGDFPHTPLYARVPLVPGVNDSLENISETAQFCSSLQNCKVLEFLPYHRLGIAAYQYIHRPYTLADLPSLTFEEAYQRVAFLQKQKLPFEIMISGRTI
ncbi:MAG: hypothetical protein ACRC3H_22995 [Lachnospiraceae bacterium]